MLLQNYKLLNTQSRTLNSRDPAQDESSDPMAHAFPAPIAHLEGVVRTLERVRDKKESKFARSLAPEGGRKRDMDRETSGSRPRSHDNSCDQSDRLGGVSRAGIFSPLIKLSRISNISSRQRARGRQRQMRRCARARRRRRQRRWRRWR